MSDKDDRPKKSWREIDAGRDRSGGGQRREPPGDKRFSPATNDRQSKQYRAALDALFEKGGFSKFAEKVGAPGSPAPRAEPKPQAPVAEEPATPTPKSRAAAPVPEPTGRAALRKKIVEAIGRDEVTRAVDRWLKEFPLPDDFEVLEQALDHRKPERVLEVLARLEALLAREQPKRSRTLAARLRTLVETSYDDEIRHAAERARAKLV